MSELSAASRALLDAAREGLAPPPATVERIRAGVDRTIVPGAAAGAATAKLGVTAVIAALLIGGGLYTQRPTTAVAPSLQLPAAHVETAAPELAPVTSQVEAAPAAPVAVPGARGKLALPPAIDLAREVALIDRAMASLRGGDPHGALAAIRVHALETRGAGQLAEDAAAIEIEALCSLHDPRVAARLDAFDERFPRSAQRSRLTSSCP